MRIAIVLMCIICTSCSPQKKLNRLVKKHPELIKVDTIKVHDTTITEHVRKDTMLSWATLYDTAYIFKDKLSIRVVRVNDSIYIRGECLPDTIVKTIEVPYNYVNVVKTDKKINHNLLIFIFFLLLLIAALFKLK